MAFVPPPPSSSDRQSRQNILQELQQQKQQLLQQGQTTTLGSPAIVTATSSAQRATARTTMQPEVPRSHTTEPAHGASSSGASMSRRSALEYASAHSNGYFVAVDSQFGNTILPAIPRLDDS